MNSVIKAEMDQVISNYKSYLVSDGMKETFSIGSARSSNIDDWMNDHEYLREFDRYLNSGKDIGLVSLPSLDEIFLAIERGETIYPADLIIIAELLSWAGDVHYLLSDESDFYHLSDDALSLDPVSELRRLIENDIESDLTISSKASLRLREIRQEKNQVNSRLSTLMTSLKERYRDFLSDDLITIRGGQEVLPVKADCKNDVRGTIVSRSASGETLYMTPYEALDLHNRLKNLEDEENQEVMKILSDLSSRCRHVLKALRKDYEIYLRFDRYIGAVRFGKSYDGSIAEESEGSIVLRSLVHPLIDAKEVVPNTVVLGGEEPRVLMISGPNAGGKSVLIRSIALAYLMDRSGLLVPARGGAKLPFIDELYFIGGDNQSVADNLSTFSSHLIAMKETIAEATRDSLVIIDEIGEGTSPKDGEALSVGFLNYFIKLSSFTIITSHYDGLKMYAASKPEVLSGAMEYDLDGLRPTFHLLLHTTGKSYGLSLAESLGLDETIIADARDHQSNQDAIDIDALVTKLNKQVQDNERIERELEKKRDDLDRAIAKRERAISALEKERESIHKRADDRINRIVEQKLSEIEAAWQARDDGEIHFNEVAEAKGKLKKIASQSNTDARKARPKRNDVEFSVGDIVADEDGRRARVLEIKKDEVRLDMDGLKFTRTKEGLTRVVKTVSDLKKEGALKDQASSFDKVFLSADRGIELNIIGLHVDEAMREVSSFIDHAVVRRIKSVRIIHGAGTFALKNAVWRYLGEHSDIIRDYRSGGEGEGGLGATIVYLR